MFSASGAELTPEQEILNHYAGEWDGTLSNLPGVKLHVSCEWILNGKFLRHSISADPATTSLPISSLQLMPYDTAKGVYRAWSFYSNGASVEGEGTWDAASKLFTWTIHEPDGTTIVTKVSFPDADSETTVTEITNRDGQIVSQIRGAKTRRKLGPAPTQRS
jgi:hypothetical protein